MLRDQRVNVSDSSKTMPFSELAELAIRHEQDIKAKTRTRTKTENNTGRLQNYTQEEINSFVIRQMRHTHHNNNSRQDQGSTTNVKRHSKRPSQEEINEFVVRQMREEQERKTRARSKSEPKPSNQAPITTTKIDDHRTTKSADDDDQYAKCDTCGRITHAGQQRCHHHDIAKKDAKTPVVQVPRGNFLPKKVEFVKRTAGGLPTYRTGFALT